MDNDDVWNMLAIKQSLFLIIVREWFNPVVYAQYV